MQIKVNFLCKDSILAAPLVIDLVRLLDVAKRCGERGIQRQLSLFFKAPYHRDGERAGARPVQAERRCSRSGWQKVRAGPAVRAGGLVVRASLALIQRRRSRPSRPGRTCAGRCSAHEERRAVLGVLDRGVLSGQFAPEVRGLEREFAAFVGLAVLPGHQQRHRGAAPGAVGAGVGPGDEVIVPAFSFVATAMAVLHQSAVPVFVDIEPQTFGLDPAKVEAAITPAHPGHRAGAHPRRPLRARSPSPRSPPRRGLSADRGRRPRPTAPGTGAGTPAPSAAPGCFSLQSSQEPGLRRGRPARHRRRGS